MSHYYFKVFKVIFCVIDSQMSPVKRAILNHWTTLFQEAAGEGIPILLLGNKMDMDGDREVSFKEAERLAYVSFIQSLSESFHFTCSFKIIILF